MPITSHARCQQLLLATVMGSLGDPARLRRDTIKRIQERPIFIRNATRNT